MDYEQIKKKLAPCGLHCGKCFAFKDGDIGEYSRRLKNSLGEFDVYAERFVDLIEEPVMLKYPDFKEMLNSAIQELGNQITGKAVTLLSQE